MINLALYIPQFGVVDAYGTDTAGLDNALGIYLSAWGIVTLIFLIACLRSSIALISLFFFLDVTFWLLYVSSFTTNGSILINSAAGFFSGVENVTKAGGAFGIVSPLVHGVNEAHTNNQLTAAIAGYTALAGLLTKDTSYFLLPVGDQSKKRL